MNWSFAYIVQTIEKKYVIKIYYKRNPLKTKTMKLKYNINVTHWEKSNMYTIMKPTAKN